MKPPVCAKRGCVTALSFRNPGEFCWTHTPDLGNPGTSHLKPRRVMSEGFLAGIEGTYEPTATDRARMRRGDW